MGETIFDDDVVRRVSKRIHDAKLRLISRAPFYGSLILRLKVGLGRCNTACTDMVRVIFDPGFVDEISDEELDFVMKHEILHCVLSHCTRGKGFNNYFFNIACDIVVNSNIMNEMGVSKFVIAGQEVMHQAPAEHDREGFKYSAEEVYEMLMEKHAALIRDVEEVIKEVEQEYGVIIDNHNIWDTITANAVIDEEWKQAIKEAVRVAKGYAPPAIRKLLDAYEDEAKISWRQILHNFIVSVADRYDFSFLPPDKRFSTSEFIMPSFSECTGEEIKNLWFLIDTSASMTEEELSVFFYEIKSALFQFDYLSGMLSYFDTEVTEPVEFDSVDKLMEIKPFGGGGTSFVNIFKYMNENMQENLPLAIIIMTDGYAPFPNEESAMGIPVLWIISSPSVEAPWGTTIHYEEVKI